MKDKETEVIAGIVFGLLIGALLFMVVIGGMIWAMYRFL